MRVARRVLLSGVAVAAIGGVVSLVYLFQPWRTCPYDDTPAACAMLSTDATVLAVAVAVTFLGLATVLVGVGLGARRAG